MRQHVRKQNISITIYLSEACKLWRLLIGRHAARPVACVGAGTRQHVRKQIVQIMILSVRGVQALAPSDWATRSPTRSMHPCRYAIACKIHSNATSTEVQLLHPPRLERDAWSMAI